VGAWKTNLTQRPALFQRRATLKKSRGAIKAKRIDEMTTGRTAHVEEFLEITR
jgi:hypothetical protein